MTAPHGTTCFFFFFFNFPGPVKKRNTQISPHGSHVPAFLHVEKRNHRLCYRLITSEQSRLGSNGRCAAPTAAHAESSGVLKSSTLLQALGSSRAAPSSKLPRPRHRPLSASEADLPCCLLSVSALPICCLRGTTGTPRNHQCHTAFHVGRHGVCTLQGKWCTLSASHCPTRAGVCVCVCARK